MHEADSVDHDDVRHAGHFLFSDPHARLPVLLHPFLVYSLLPTCPTDFSPWLRRQSRGNEARILEHQFTVAVVNLRGYAAIDTAHQSIQ